MFRINFVFLLVLLCLTFITNSCECVVKICAGSFMFRVLDKQSRKDLVYEDNPRYVQDSVFLVRQPGISSRISFPTARKFISNMVVPADTLFLHLSPTDYDTLVMTYRYKQTKCCDAPKGFAMVSSIQFNGMPAPFENGSYLLLK